MLDAGKCQRSHELNRLGETKAWVLSPFVQTRVTARRSHSSRDQFPNDFVSLSLSLEGKTSLLLKWVLYAAVILPGVRIRHK